MRIGDEATRHPGVASSWPGLSRWPPPGVEPRPARTRVKRRYVTGATVRAAEALDHNRGTLRLSKTVNITDLRRLAKRRLPPVVFDYIDGGAEDEVTLRANERAFAEIAFRPRQCVETTGGALALRIEHPAEADGREQERQIVRRTEDAGAKVRGRRLHALPRPERHLRERAFVGAQRDLVLGAAVDVAEDDGREPAPGEAPEVRDIDDAREVQKLTLAASSSTIWR